MITQIIEKQYYWKDKLLLFINPDYYTQNIIPDIIEDTQAKYIFLSEDKTLEFIKMNKTIDVIFINIFQKDLIMEVSKIKPNLPIIAMAEPNHKPKSLILELRACIITPILLSEFFPAIENIFNNTQIEA